MNEMNEVNEWMNGWNEGVQEARNERGVEEWKNGRMEERVGE
jgi:hypothetical protein